MESHGSWILHADSAYLPRHSLRAREQWPLRRLQLAERGGNLSTAIACDRQWFQRFAGGRRRQDLYVERRWRDACCRCGTEVHSHRNELNGRVADGNTGIVRRCDVCTVFGESLRNRAEALSGN